MILGQKDSGRRLIMRVKEIYDNVLKNTNGVQATAIKAAIAACEDLADFVTIDGIIGAEGEKENSELYSALEDIKACFDKKIISVIPVEYKKIEKVDEARAYFRLIPYESIWKLVLLCRVIELAKVYDDLREVYEEAADENNYLFLALINEALGYLKAQ
jgi:hypothetical protein